MTDRWRAFEKTMWARVKVFDARRKMTFWQKVGFYLNDNSRSPVHGLIFVMRGALTVFVMLLLWLHAAEIREHPVVAIAMAGWWAMAAALFRPIVVWEPHRRLFPLTLDRLFLDELKRRTIGAVWLYVELATVYALALSSRELSGAKIAAIIVVAAFQCLLSLSITASITALRLNPALLLFPFMIILLGLTFTTPEGPLGVFFLNPVFGWVNDALWNGVALGQFNAFLMVFPALAIVATLPLSLKSVRLQHHAGILHDPARVNCHKWRFPNVGSESDEQSPVEFSSLVKQSSRKWNGMIDQLVSRLLTTRDRNILEISEIEPTTFSRRYWKVIFYCALFAAINLFVPDLKSQSPTDALAQLFVSEKQYHSAGTALPSPLRIGGLVLVTFLPFILGLWALVVVFVKVLLFQLSLVNSPERFQRTDSNCYKSLCLFPVTHLEVELAVVKTSTIFTLLLIPPAALISVCPVGEVLAHGFRQSTVLLLKAPVLVWLAMVCGSGLRLLPWGGSEWRKAFCVYRNLGILLIFAVIGSVFGFAPSPWDWISGPFVIAIFLLWFAWCAAGYKREWKWNCPDVLRGNKS